VGLLTILLFAYCAQQPHTRLNEIVSSREIRRNCVEIRFDDVLRLEVVKCVAEGPQGELRSSDGGDTDNSVASVYVGKCHVVIVSTPSTSKRFQ
jgi:hypothetical protein